MSCGTTIRVLSQGPCLIPSTQDHGCANGEAEGGEDGRGVQQIRGLLEIYGKDIEKGGHRYPALLSDSTLPQYEVYKKLVWERGWGGGGKSDEVIIVVSARTNKRHHHHVYEVIIMEDSLRKLLPD